MFKTILQHVDNPGMSMRHCEMINCHTIDIVDNRWPVVLTLPIADCNGGKTDKNEADPEDEDNHKEDCVVFSRGKVEFRSSPVRGIIWE